MIGCRCDRCGVRIPTRDEPHPSNRITFTNVLGREEHFCSIPCVTAWAIDYGCYKPPAVGVVDADVFCGATSPTGSECKFTADHPGTHVSHRGEEWTDNHALIWHLEQAVRNAFDASNCGDVDDSVHYRGKAVGLQSAIDIVKALP